MLITRELTTGCDSLDTLVLGLSEKKKLSILWLHVSKYVSYCNKMKPTSDNIINNWRWSIWVAFLLPRKGRRRPKSTSKTVDLILFKRAVSGLPLLHGPFSMDSGLTKLLVICLYLALEITKAPLFANSAEKSSSSANSNGNQSKVYSGRLSELSLSMSAYIL